jgi:uncharacterized protein
MSTENKRIMQHIFSELAKGNGEPFLHSLADDVRWHVTGTTKFSKTYEGKQSILNDLVGPLFSRFADQYTNTAERFIAEDDYVVVECKGKVTTKSGLPYNNKYCWVCRFEDGKVKELTEYMDTHLVVTALGG